MESMNAIDFVGRLYELVKTDLYTLLVDGSTNKIDYKGKVSFIGRREAGGLVNIAYLLVNPTDMGYNELVQVCCFTLNNMLKHDIQMWKKADTVEEFYGISPKFDSSVQFELSLKWKAED